ncbi:vitamin B12 ABC transporter substrate-binding protein BtuF [Vibrio ostreicida]|uniref:Vitamin B12-binding protein n=1 Tax=Vibrio ostreicida TaxID=526588 RepID=A0ABT8BXX6_9VIBR|nr:vitamin B12 ABC transporter substrate-binding protein BtuF [Vibrio ostreicida]MDN3610928.1 vitamin B12 ABC transporter substrate-binding protein BtuF [Vibrio ostreicida]NPD10508.1 vitamin B12 ABC transporter substrate-binding protein BtuF [Vibrio ostreicida]
MQARLLLLLLLSSSIYAAPAERIISLAPHATELAYAAGLGDQLIAVSEHSDYPIAAQKLEKVSNYQGLKLERIIALQPDLIIAWPSGNPARELDKLKQFGFNIYDTNTGTLDDIASNIEQLSQYSQDPSVGNHSATQFREKLRQLKQTYQTDSPVRYFYQLSATPLMTVANGKWPSEVFSFCGGVNIFENSSVSYPQIGKELVLLRDPDVIFTSEHRVAEDNTWHDWQGSLTAVRESHIWSLNSDWLNRPTIRTLNAVEEICQYFEKVRQNR